MNEWTVGEAIRTFISSLESYLYELGENGELPMGLPEIWNHLNAAIRRAQMATPYRLWNPPYGDESPPMVE